MAEPGLGIKESMIDIYIYLPPICQYELNVHSKYKWCLYIDFCWCILTPVRPNTILWIIMIWYEQPAKLRIPNGISSRWRYRFWDGVYSPFKYFFTVTEVSLSISLIIPIMWISYFLSSSCPLSVLPLPFTLVTRIWPPGSSEDCNDEVFYPVGTISHPVMLLGVRHSPLLPAWVPNTHWLIGWNLRILQLSVGLLHCSHHCLPLRMLQNLGCSQLLFLLRGQIFGHAPCRSLAFATEALVAAVAGSNAKSVFLACSCPLPVLVASWMDMGSISICGPVFPDMIFSLSRNR